MSPLFARKLAEIKAQLPQGPQLLIVSKTRPIQDIQAYYELGHRDFGENRVQELEEKSKLLQTSCPEIRWHMIGHLQSNKINQLLSVPNLYAIHSVHDRSLLEKLLKAQQRLSGQVKIFLQVNTSKEEEKSGFESYQDVVEAAKSVPPGGKLVLAGLMTMGTLRTDNFEAEARRCFRELHGERQRLEKELGFSLKCSMGMSQDYQIALEEHSDWIRLGTLMFV